MSEEIDNEVLLWIDLETTGLDPGTSCIIEIAAVVTDNAGNEIYACSLPVIPDLHIPDWEHEALVMHASSGLLAKVYSAGALPLRLAISMILEGSIILDSGSKIVLCGNSVWFDRAFLEAESLCPDAEGEPARFLVEALSHRMIDTSSFIEMSRRVNPALYARRPVQSTETKHRALEDIRHSIECYKFFASILSDWEPK